MKLKMLLEDKKMAEPQKANSPPMAGFFPTIAFLSEWQNQYSDGKIKKYKFKYSKEGILKSIFEI